MGRKVGNGIDKSYQCFLHPKICILGAAVPVRDGAVEFILITTQDLKSSIDRGSRGLRDDFVTDLRVRLAYSFEDSAKLVGIKSFKESGQVERPTGYLVGSYFL